jgi:microcystin degradation protein MlrC
MGIDPRSRKVVVVKSFAHFQAAFSTVARKILYTAGPGPLPIDPRTVPLTRVRRPIWPLDPEPFVGAA